MPASEIVRARIDATLKNRATLVLEDMGLTVSDAIRLMLVRIVADEALPFEIRTPNAETEAALREARAGKVERFTSVTAALAAAKKDTE
ncbi:type II toxin-antitoxin system RelB/DinJ family antitoxin [Sphingopyxis sp. DBS4]|uniref:type II toxin-antitoxin system RelB/DinJ family antitoxin n=1 Tax=Sphingopyxis sp. DBS4 TaxID=2968500 RepID=UPI00214AF86C|nr:type II toxin-antitoxin system RelB/DinJ family antitoxin [Sphingopyxis sp. DBS4]